MDSNDGNLVLKLFGQSYASELPDNKSGRIKAIKVKLRLDIKEYKELGDPLSLEDAISTPLRDGEWWCPVEFDGARWKTYIIPPHWLSRGEWDAHEATVISKGLSKDDPYGKGFLKMMRDTTAGTKSDLSVDAAEREEILEQLELIFRKMEGCEDDETWNLLAVAFRAGQHFSKLFSNEEGKRIAKKGFKQVEQQGKGRPSGSTNVNSKKKEHEEAKDTNLSCQKEIVSLWRKTSDHNPYNFMDILVARELAEKHKDDYHYRLAGKGKFQTPESCTRKIREWVKKSQ